MFTRKTLGLAAAGLFSPSLAFAHSGHGIASGFLHGFAHPLSGLDHVLAMVLVGMLSFQFGGRALLALPVSFVALMAAAGALGMTGIELPFVETGIAISIVVLGAAAAFRTRAPLFSAMALVGLFAIFHGHAHGAEMPADAGGLVYAAGFLLATALLHAAGLGFGFALARTGEAKDGLGLRLAGAAAAGLGVAILTGIL